MSDEKEIKEVSIKITKCPPAYAYGYVPMGHLPFMDDDNCMLPVSGETASLKYVNFKYGERCKSGGYYLRPKEDGWRKTDQKRKGNKWGDRRSTKNTYKK